MKSSNINQAYFSTSQAAKLLGLSVGTIQRMVENGIFKAYVTQGGHRRILSSSFTQYCKQQGFSSPQVASVKPLICILHDSTHLPPAVHQLAQWDHVKVITHPLDLMGLDQHVGAFFIDARIPWLHDAPIPLQDTLMRDAHIAVYNSASLPKGSPLHLGKKIKLFDGDISTDLVYGYLLGSAHESDTAECNPISQ